MSNYIDLILLEGNSSDVRIPEKKSDVPVGQKLDRGDDVEYEDFYDDDKTYFGKMK